MKKRKNLITKPMKAPSEPINVPDFGSLNYPLIASPKVDGIRAITSDKGLLSSTFKMIPNRFIQKTLKGRLPPDLDGELTVGDTFQDSTSGIMSHDGEPDFMYWLFDYVKDSLDKPYKDRIKDLGVLFRNTLKKSPLFVGRRQAVIMLETVWVYDPEDLEAYEADCLDRGFEGAMVRDPEGPYKCGRATLKQGQLLKVKRFDDSEARIIGFEEQMENTNKAEKDNFGRTKRSSAKSGKKGKGTLGKFIAEECGGRPWTKPLKIGTGKGLTHKLRQEIWDNQDEWLGKIVKYKFQPHGVKDAPRIPIFVGFRDERDM